MKKIKSPIFSALEKGDISMVGELMKDQTHLLATDEWDNTPAMIATREGYEDVALEMLRRGSPHDHVSKLNGATPLSFAAMAGCVEVGRALLDLGTDPNQKTSDPDLSDSEMSALMWAVNRRHPAFVRLLLESGADVNATNELGQTALMFAKDGSAKSNEVLELLLQHNPDIHIKDWRGRCIVDEARARANNSSMPAMKELIQKYFPDVAI